MQPDTTARTFCLPSGRWIDFWTNERVDRSDGGGNHNWSNADRTKLPVFIRDGAIIPMLLAARPVQLELLVLRPSSGVHRDGTLINEESDPGQFALARSAWRHDEFLQIKFTHPGGLTTVTF